VEFTLSDVSWNEEYDYNIDGEIAASKVENDEFEALLESFRSRKVEQVDEEQRY